MYFPPRKYKCEKGHNFTFSEDHDYFGFKIPYCPVCYRIFLKDNIGIGNEVSEIEDKP